MQKVKVVLFDKSTKKGQFINYGLGKITKILKCEVTEELNGRYDTELLIYASDSKQKLIKKWSVIYIDGQLFRVVTRTDIDKDHTVKIFAKHIFYDINSGFIIDSRAEKTTVLEAMKIAVPSDFKDTFEVASNINEIESLYFVKNNGAENFFNIIDRWKKGELGRDNFKISINESKGADRGVTFTYKKIEAIEVDEDTENVVTRLYPTGKDGIALEEKYITIPGWNTEDYPPFHITKEVKFEGAESTGELRVLALKEAETIGLSRVNFKINVHDLYNYDFAGDIEALKKVEVGDIVTIKHHILDVRVKVKCIKKIHERITDKVTLELGQPLQNFFDSVDNNNNQITIPDVSKYEEHMFFFYNDSKVVINKSSSELCFLRYGVTNTTNLMLYFNMFFECTKNCTIKLAFKIDNELLNFGPELNFTTGKRCFNFTYPLLNTEGGKAHTLSAVIMVDDGTTLTIPPENLQVIIRGQNVSGSMKEGPHAEVEEILDFSKFNRKSISLKSGIVSKKYKPRIYKENERFNHSEFNYKVLKEEATAEIVMINRGYDRPIDKLNYIYNKDFIEIIEGKAKIKTMQQIALSKVCETQLELGVLQELELIDSNIWHEIKGGEFINNDNEIPNKR